MANRYNKTDVRVLIEVMRKFGYTYSCDMLINNGFKLPGLTNSTFWYLSHYSFAFSTPFKRVPLYVANEELRYLVEWRLKIGK